jgi:hypothetical protein
MMKANETENVIKNIIRDIIRECASRGVNVTENCAAYVVRSTKNNTEIVPPCYYILVCHSLRNHSVKYLIIPLRDSPKTVVHNMQQCGQNCLQENAVSKLTRFFNYQCWTR